MLPKALLDSPRLSQPLPGSLSGLSQGHPRLPLALSRKEAACLIGPFCVIMGVSRQSLAIWPWDPQLWPETMLLSISCPKW